MFCFNCGEKVMDGAKFCPNCGTNLMVAAGGGQAVNAPQLINRESTVVHEIETRQENSEEYTEEELVEIHFKDVFKGRRQFGDQVYIIGKDPVTQEIKENMQEFYLSDDDDEKPLLVFDYGKELKEGFVITNQRLVWYFGSSSGQQEIDLDEIKDVQIGKAVLATVMNVISFDNVKYKNIYLTGIRNETDFVLKFRQFIDRVHLIYYGEDEEEEQCDDYADNENDTDFIIRACRCVNMNPAYCEVGNPIAAASSKKYADAKTNFRIPDDEDVFLIYDATILGGCRKGFAICTTGIYYYQSRLGFWDWEQFKSVNVSHSAFTGLLIGNESFTASGGDGKNLVMILKTIQEYL